MEKENLYSPETLIDLITESDLSISRISKETNIPLPTLKNYVYGKTEPASMQYRMIKDLTEFFRNGQPLEVMLKEYDFIMIDSEHTRIGDFPYIKDLQIHTFKSLAELYYRNKVAHEDEYFKFEPFLVVLTEEILRFFQSDITNYWFFAGLLDNAKKLNLKFITSEQILMNDNLMFLRECLSLKNNFEMFFKCSDREALKKLSKLDETLEQPKRFFSKISTINSIMSEYAYYLLLGVNSSNISIPLLNNLEPGCLNSFENDAIMSNPLPKNRLLSITFDTLTEKFDFITAISLSDYDNLFNNKHPYYTESQFSGEVKEDTFSKLDSSKKLLSNIKIVKVDDLITDIKHAIRPNHFDIKTFIIDNKVDTMLEIKINVANAFKDEDVESNYIDRHLIYSIEYINLDGKTCVYNF